MIDVKIDISTVICKKNNSLRLTQRKNDVVLYKSLVKFKVEWHLEEKIASN